MCGIIGFNFTDEALGRRMTDSIKLRGPDDAGVFAGPRATIGNRRLSVIDLSSTGHQPMMNEAGTVALVYNGEVYNHQKLRTELIAKGYRFKGTSDTEVILRGYEEYGEAIVEKLEGMWAFALYDLSRDKLILSRDFFGIKPLFYYQSGDTFVFASEIKAIRLFLEEKKKSLTFCDLALHSYFSLGYSIAPFTIFEEVKKVLPRETISFDLRTGKTSSSFTHWQGNAISDPIRFEEVLLASVERHLRADVPVGLFLSGGADSTLIALLLKKLGKRLRAYTVRMENRGLCGENRGICGTCAGRNSI